MIALITIAVILALFFIIRFLLFRSLARNSMNPIDSICVNGCMGFMLGDSKPFVLSRIRHLNLMNEEEREKHKSFEKLGLTKSPDAFIETSANRFNNIDRLSFLFKNDILTCIILHIVPESCSINDMWTILVSKLQSQLRISITETSIERTVWRHSNGSVGLLLKDDRLSVIVSL